MRRSPPELAHKLRGMGFLLWNRKGSLDEAVALLAGKKIAVLTGAGVSTDSGIPDYRGQGAPIRKPMSFDTFLSSEAARRRYWAGSHIGWQFFDRVLPNDGHLALTRMQQFDLITGILTQNVDVLHERAGSTGVTHMHGRLDRVRCLDCSRIFDRSTIGTMLAEANTEFFDRHADLRPDGDAEVDPGEDFAIPNCLVCGGMLKPDVVFFGEFLPGNVLEECNRVLDRSTALLVAGSSLVVNSGLRIVRYLRKAGHDVVIVNRGDTKGDSQAAVKLDGGTSEILTELADRLTEVGSQ